MLLADSGDGCEEGGLSRKDLYSDIGLVLKSSVDWDDHRGKRKQANSVNAEVLDADLSI